MKWPLCAWHGPRGALRSSAALRNFASSNTQQQVAFTQAGHQRRPLGVDLRDAHTRAGRIRRRRETQPAAGAGRAWPRGGIGSTRPPGHKHRGKHRREQGRNYQGHAAGHGRPALVQQLAEGASEVGGLLPVTT
ncbi:MAG: hypothetical protein Q7U73_12850 [Rubrivivax sp.]|nr:hypothetical protein [Rubrivivax sp.]